MPISTTAPRNESQMMLGKWPGGLIRLAEGPYRLSTFSTSSGRVAKRIDRVRESPLSRHGPTSRKPVNWGTLEGLSLVTQSIVVEPDPRHPGTPISYQWDQSEFLGHCSKDTGRSGAYPRDQALNRAILRRDAVLEPSSESLPRLHRFLSSERRIGPGNLATVSEYQL